MKQLTDFEQGLIDIDFRFNIGCCKYISVCAMDIYDPNFFNKEGCCADGGENCQMKRIKDYFNKD